MNRRIVRFAALFCCMVTVASFATGCDGSKKTGKVTNEKLYKNASYATESLQSGEVAQKGRFVLNWDDEEKRVTFCDKETGRTYSSTPADALKKQTDSRGIIIKNNPQVESPLIVYYQDTKTLQEKSAFAYIDAITDGYVYSEKINDGIRVRYDFTALEMSVGVDYTVDNDKFSISVNPNEIYDNGKSIITAISLAPFMCGVKNDTADSYLFIPDGCGALLSDSTYSLTGQRGVLSVYGNDLSIESYDYKSFTKQINLPVYGFKSGNTAVCAIIDSGAVQSDIEWNIGSSNIKYSTVYPTFHVRGYNLLESPEGFTSTDIEIKTFDKQLTSQKLSVSFYPLYDSNATYVGMAQTYRKYLIDNKGLKPTGNSDGTPVIKLIGAVNQKEYIFGVPHTKLESLTTVKNAKEIIKYFSDNGIKSIYDLVGFGKGGMDLGKVAGGAKVAGSLGSQNDVAGLTGYCKKQGSQIYMDFDLLGFTKAGSGFTKKNDAAKQVDLQNIYHFCYDTVTRKKLGKRYMLLSRDSLDKAADKVTGYSDKVNFDGIALDSLSHVKYSDYSSAKSIVCEGMEKDVQKVYSNVSGKGFKILSSNANDYSAVKSNYITNAPSQSSQVNSLLYDVPFYQIVFKGYIPMSSESVNLSDDRRDIILRCAEFGISPQYTLFYNYSNSLITYSSSFTFGSAFNGNKEDIVKDVKELSELYKRINKSVIVNHEVLKDGIRITTYDNGQKVIVNRTDIKQTVLGIDVLPFSYTVTEG